MMPIRVLLVDDHRMFLKGLRRLLEGEPDLLIVGEANTGAEALASVRTLQPDIVLLDMNLPDLNGADVTRLILEDWPATGIIMLTAYHDDGQVFRAIQSGARGYVHKDAEVDEVLAAIRSVAQGAALIAPAVTARLLKEFQRIWQQPVPALPLTADGRPLTRREQELLRGLTGGLSNKELGVRLGFSEKTIRNTLTRLFQKIGVRDRAQAAAYAVQYGLATVLPPIDSPK